MSTKFIGSSYEGIYKNAMYPVIAPPSSLAISSFVLDGIIADYVPPATSSTVLTQVTIEYMTSIYNGGSTFTIPKIEDTVDIYFVLSGYAGELYALRGSEAAVSKLKDIVPMMNEFRDHARTAFRCKPELKKTYDIVGMDLAEYIQQALGMGYALDPIDPIGSLSKLSKNKVPNGAKQTTQPVTYDHYRGNVSVPFIFGQ